MIEQIPDIPRLPKSLRKNKKINNPQAGAWDSQCKDVISFKKALTQLLAKLQRNKCAYCGNLLGVSSRAEIEHIAPKGGTKKPQHYEYAFTPANLVLSCNLCNCSENKGTKDTIKIKNIDYSKCEFRIVHPYFDDPNDHYAWDNFFIGAISDKAAWTIRHLGLATTERTQGRIMQNLYEQLAEQEKRTISLISTYKKR